MANEFLQALLAFPEAVRPLVSPDRRWVAWSWLKVGPTADVYVAACDGSDTPRRLTATGQNTYPLSWTSDSAALLVTHDREGDERLQIFRVARDRPAELTALTEPNPPFFLRGGQLHPNGRWLVYAANYDAETGREIEARWLYRHDITTGERLVLARPSRADAHAPELNRQGTQIIYSRNELHPAGNQYWLVDIEGQNDREILNFGPEMKIEATWLADGAGVLVLSQTATHRRVGVWRNEAVRWLIDDPARNIEEAFVPAGPGSQVVLVEVRETRLQASLLDVETGQEQKLGQIPGNLLPLVPLNDGQSWLGHYYSARQPIDVVRFDLLPAGEPAKLTSLTRVWDLPAARQVAPDALAAAEDFRWQAADGLAVQGWLFRARPGTNDRGTVIQVHGGPTAHAEDRFSAFIQYLVNQGFNVLTPNYRGSTGFSLAFEESIKEDGWGGREQEDIRAGIEALITAGIAQPGRVGITGTSYGGYSSWCAITHFPVEIVAASAPICGMTDLVVDYETTRPDLRPYSEEMLGGRPDQLPQKYYERSPINFVGNIRGRLLIIQGLQDPNVTPQNVEVVEKALEAAAIPYQTLTFPDEGHGIARPANQQVLYERLAEFFGGAWR